GTSSSHTFVLSRWHALLRGARTHVDANFRVVGVVRAERVAKEVEAFLTGIPQRGFRLVDRQPELGHYLLRLKFLHRGYEVHAFLSAAEALQALRAGFTPSAIIIDLAMPDGRLTQTGTPAGCVR